MVNLHKPKDFPATKYFKNLLPVTNRVNNAAQLHRNLFILMFLDVLTLIFLRSYCFRSFGIKFWEQ